MEKHGNALILPDIHELTMLCLRAGRRDEARRIQSSAISSRTRITLLSDHLGQDNIFGLL